MKGNKSQIQLLGIFFTIMIFSLVSLIGVTLGYLYFAIGNDYVVLPLYNASIGFNSSPEITAGFENTVGNYQSTDLSFIDRMWAFGYIVLVMISFMIAYRDKTTNYFTWLSMLTYGLMFVLYIVGLFSVLLNWWYNDILLGLFNNLAVNVPMLAYFILHYGFIFLIHASALLLINIVDFDLSTILNRKKKERAAMEDDELI